ncbi:hypothetical protein B0H63DRAFT_488271, partial [Podospora didyma]
FPNPSSTLTLSLVLLQLQTCGSIQANPMGALDGSLYSRHPLGQPWRRLQHRAYFDAQHAIRSQDSVGKVLHSRLWTHPLLQ